MYVTQHTTLFLMADLKDSIDVAQIKPLLSGINTIIMAYAINAPFKRFVNACVKNRKGIIFWLQKNFKFNRTIKPNILQKAYDELICLSKSEKTIDWYERRFNVICFPMRCINTV